MTDSMVVTVVDDWRAIEPRDAVNIILDYRSAPLNEAGMRCPWPWEPQQLVGARLGQYHCPYCGGMQLAGVQHFDCTDEDSVRYEAWVVVDFLRWLAGHPRDERSTDG